MADDVAALGFDVDSTPLVTGEKSLRALASASKATGEVVDQTNAKFSASADASQRMIAGMTAVNDQSQRMIEGMSAVGRQTLAANDNIIKFTTSTNAQRAGLVNLSRQLQDVFVSLTSGQAPMQVAIQQGTQIADVFANGQLSAGHLARQVGGLAQQFIGFIGPLGVVTLGIGAVAAAAGALFLLFRNQGRTLDQSLEEQARLIKIVKDAYSDAANAAGEFLKQSKALTELQLSRNIAELDKQLESLVAQFRTALIEFERIPDLSTIFAFLRGQDVTAFATGFAEIDAALNKFFASARRAEDVQALINQLAEMGNSARGNNKPLTDMSLKIIDLLEKAGKLAPKLQEDAAAMTRMGEAAALSAQGLALLKTAMNAVNQTTAGLEQQAATLEIQAKASTMSAGAAAEYVAVETARQKLIASGVTITDELNKKLTEEGSRIRKATEEIATNREAMHKQGAATKETTKDTLDYVDVMQANVGALGSAATEMEKYQLKVAQLTKQFQEGKISADTFNRAIVQAHPIVVKLQDTIEDLGSALAKAFIEGADAAEALNRSLKSIASTAASSAIKNLLQGNLAGAAISGVVALGAWAASSLFGGEDTSQQEQEFAAAQKALDQQISEWSQAVTSAKATADTLDQALAAFDAAAQTQIKELLAQTSSGMISTAQGAAAVAALEAKLASERQAIIEEFAQKAIEAEQKAAEAVEAIAEARAQLIAKVAEEEAQAIAEATETMQQALAVLEQIDLSPVEQELAAIEDASDTLQDALIALGFSAEAAAAAVNDKLNVALDRLRTEFIEDLIAKVNELAGGAWINQAEALAKEVAQLQADAATLGVTTSLINDFYVLSAQKIVDQNQLTGESFLALEAMLGLAGTSLHEFVQAVEDTATAVTRSTQEIQAAIQDYQDQLFILQQNQDTLAGKLAVFELEAQRAREAEIAKGGQALAALIALQEAQKAKIISDWNKKILQEQQDALEAQLKAQKKAAEEQARLWKDAVDFIQGIRERITSFIAGFLSGPQSFLSPQQQMEQGVSFFNQQLALAQGGDQAALSNITSTAQAALDAIKAYYGSTATGAAMQKAILEQLSALPNQLTPEMFIVQATEQQTAALQADNAAQLEALLSIKTAADMATLVQEATAANTAQTASAAEAQAVATATQAENWASALLMLAQIASNTAATAEVIPMRLSISEGLLATIDATLTDGFSRLISAVVISSETETAILRAMAADFSTLAKAERRVA